MATGGGCPNIPPRLQKSKSIKREGTKSSVDILQQMGFSQQRAEKAIAATGDKSVQLAADWLLSHVGDRLLDDNTPRQYTLYLCPVGEHHEQLMEFWEKSLSACGWNGSHSYFPHATLCSFFSVENHQASRIKQAFQKLESLMQSAPGSLKMDFFSQNNFIGLFVQEHFYKYLSDIVVQFAAEVNKYGIQMETTPKKQMHITLAYQYSGEHDAELNKLAKQIDLNASTQWEIRLYSRDSLMDKKEVRKVLKAYKGSLDDELDLILGDYIFMDSNETSKSQDGWYNGISWVTGMMGLFPGTYTQRTAETWTWALHGSLPLNQGVHTVVKQGAHHHGALTNGTTSSEEEYGSLWQAESLYAKVNKSRTNSSEEKKHVNSTEKAKLPRQLYVMRHGERMDFVFGRTWVDKCFDDEGEALKNAGVTLQHVYVSPSLRCIQTITGILKSMGQAPLLHVEPGIFEWLGWYQLGLPRWFTPADHSANGYNIDLTYKPYVPVAKLDLDEDIAGYYKRSGETARHILKKHEQEGGNVLIMGHAGTLDVCTRQALGKSPRSSQEFRELCGKVPYCALLSCQQDPVTMKWTLLPSPISPLSHGQNRQVITKDIFYPS